MNHPTVPSINAAVDAACARIAPTWPLDRFIAVNPWWGWVATPIEQVDATLGALAGAHLTLPREWFAARWRDDAIDAAHLQQALDEAGARLRPEDLVAALDEPAAAPRPLPLISDALDETRDLGHAPAWRDAVTHQLSQHCAAYFDTTQADWQPDRSAGLYASWISALRGDTGLARLMDASWLAARVDALAVDPRTAIAAALMRLGISERQHETFLAAVLMRIGGWAAWCAGRRWQARLEGRNDDAIVDLLAARLGWEAVLDDGQRHAGSAWMRWLAARTAHGDPQAAAPRAIDWIWQRALEIAWQAPIAQALAGPRHPATDARPTVQAVFCIDVRSEVLRRALEHVAPTVHTLGFAGFFGLPLRYAPLGTTAPRPQLPGLLAPALDAVDAGGATSLADMRRARLDRAQGWKPFTRTPGSAFTLVETLGIADLGRMLARAFGRGTPANPDHAGLATDELQSISPRVAFDGNAAVAGADLAGQVLHALGLESGFARLVLLAGHGSRSANNPHASGLDCGACCGQTGEVNARALANLLNDAAVRETLARAGLQIPTDTWFLAALHDTTLDEVALYDVGAVPASHAADLALLRTALAAAGARTRAERAPLLGLANLARDPAALHAALRERATDWSQTRPEWGLADNAGFVVAPRVRTRGVDLGGRCFLHDYDHRRDPDGRVLELIMTAPMVVTNWINLQYHASVVDPQRYGAGNKVLHNVVGGTIGVFEGNGGDLRIGLPWQSVHDGTRFVHTPRRLSVFIEAPQAMIDTVMCNHAVVRDLVQNGWLHLFSIDPGDGVVHKRSAADWTLWTEGVALAA